MYHYGVCGTACLSFAVCRLSFISTKSTNGKRPAGTFLRNRRPIITNGKRAIFAWYFAWYFFPHGADVRSGVHSLCVYSFSLCVCNIISKYTAVTHNINQKPQHNKKARTRDIIYVHSRAVSTVYIIYSIRSILYFYI